MTTSNSSTLDSSDETLNGTKLMRLILDGGTVALRNVLKGIHPVSFQEVLSKYKHILSNLKCRKVLNQIQWDTLYPTPPGLPNINDFDITLLSVLLRNICDLNPPRTGWDNKPNNFDYSVEADVVRIKLFRNQCFGHKTKTAISAANFKRIWEEISLPLIRRGVDQGEIDRLHNEKCGPDEIARVLKEWNDFDEKIFCTLESIETKLSENNNILKKIGQNELSSVVDKFLVHFDFEKEIQIYLSRYVIGTRLWVLEKVTEWFHDENSKHRAFVISSPVGMGKSVLAAVMCDKFEKNAAYCHFIQYNNSLYNNPNFLLQSLAWHLCQVFPAYKEALVKKLSGNLGQALNNMNIEGLYSTLLNELLTNKEEPEERLLVVLDAVDEIEHSGRHELENLIANHLHKLPAYIRFVITARPEKNLLDKFLKLNPLFIPLDDERNLNDIKLVLQKNLPHAYQTDDVHTSLAEKSGGLMLYAYFLTQVYQDENLDENQTSLPEGIDEYYETYLKRLEDKLRLLEISNDQFLSFLSAIAAAQDPMPEAFVRYLFQLESHLGTKQKVRDIMNSLSSLFLIHEDKSISFFHKSVGDWLVNNNNHRYCIDIKSSHDVLFDLCVQELINLKQSVTRDLKTNLALGYALKYCIVHLLQGNVDKQKMECFVTKYVTDLQVMFAGVYFNIDLTVNNIYMLTRHDCFQYISEGAKSTLNKLYLLLRKSGSLLHSYPQTFLQTVVNEGGKELSPKASDLLQSRYKNFVYLEFLNKYEEDPIYDVRCNLSGILMSVDISPSHDYAVCLYHENEIELFSLMTGRSVWNISVPSIASRRFPSMEEYFYSRFVIFHPFEKLILFGKLDEVVTFQGTVTTGPFQSDRNLSELTLLCFSSDGEKMATVHKLNFHRYILVVWNVRTGVEEHHFFCGDLDSLSFTASGKFLGVTDGRDEFKIFDLTRDCEVESRQVHNTDEPISLKIISSYDQNSWLCCCDRDRSKKEIIVLNSDFSKRQVRYSSYLKNLLVPSTFRDFSNLKSFIENHDEPWFYRAMTQISRTFGWACTLYVYYLLIDDKTLAVFSVLHNTMYIVRIEKLDNSNKTESKKTRGFTAISNKGDFVYMSGNEGKIVSICDVSSENRRLKSFENVKLLSLVVVRNGVVLFKDDGTLELWNRDLTEHLSSFDELTDVRKCLSVSDEIIACKVSRLCIVFFNVLTKEIIYRISHWLLADTVLVCSVRYHVLIDRYLMKRFCQLRLLSNEREVECAHEVFKETVLSDKSVFCGEAKFSPDGDKLIISSDNIYLNIVYIFNVDHDTIQFFGQIPFCEHSFDPCLLKFFSNEKLVCCQKTMTYLIDVEHAKILTCLDVGDLRDSISVCQERQIICLGYESMEKFEIIRICCQR